MLVVDERVADRPNLQGAYLDGSLELLRELAVTIDLDTALPRLSAIVSKMLPHDALRMARFDQRGQPVVNASTADVPDTTSGGEEVIIHFAATRRILSVVERATIVTVLRDGRGNKTKAARRLGLSRTQLHLRFRRYRLEEAATA